MTKRWNTAHPLAYDVGRVLPHRVTRRSGVTVAPRHIAVMVMWACVITIAILLGILL